MIPQHILRQTGFHEILVLQNCSLPIPGDNSFISASVRELKP